MRLWMTRLPGQIAIMAEVCDLCFDRGVSNTSQSPIKNPQSKRPYSRTLSWKIKSSRSKYNFEHKVKNEVEPKIEI